MPGGQGNYWQGIGISFICLTAAVYGFIHLIFLVEDLTVPAVLSVLLYAGGVLFVWMRLTGTGRVQTAKAFLACSIGGGLLVGALLILLIQGLTAAIGFC